MFSVPFTFASDIFYLQPFVLIYDRCVKLLLPFIICNSTAHYSSFPNLPYELSYRMMFFLLQHLFPIFRSGFLFIIFIIKLYAPQAICQYLFSNRYYFVIFAKYFLHFLVILHNIFYPQPPFYKFII